MKLIPKARYAILMAFWAGIAGAWLLPTSASAATTTIVAKHSDKCLDVAGGPQATGNGVKIDQWTCSGESNQSWTLNDTGSGEYQLIAENSGKCLDVPSGSTANGVVLQQWDCDPGDKQLWRLQPQSDGYYRIVSVATGKCVDVAGANTGDYADVHQWDCHNGGNQRWSLQVPGVTTTVVAKHSGKCLDVVGGPEATGNGVKIDQWSCTGQPDQIWQVKDMGNGQYQLIANNSGKCLDLDDGSTANGVQLQQWDCAPGDKQLWTFEPQSDGYNRIVSVASGKCVDVAGNHTNDGRAVHQWDCHNGDNQRWKLNVATDGTTPPPAPTPIYVGPISAKHSGRCLDVAGGPQATGNGNDIDQWSCTGEANQEWTVQERSGGQYELVATSSGKCLQVPDGATNGTVLEQWDCQEVDRQRWTITDEGDGFNRLVSVATSKCVEVQGASTADFALVQQSDCTGADHQQWTFASGDGIGTGTGGGGGGGGGSGDPGPYGQDASQFTLVFADEFESGFDTSVWNDHIWYQSSNPTINYAVEDGMLKIWPQRDASGNFFNRTIDTDGKYYQTYGYFEMEAKLPVGKGVWPAFWLLNHDQPDPERPELDIMEAYPGGGPNSGWSDSNLHPTNYAATVHPHGITQGGSDSEKVTDVLGGVGDLSAGFHKYAMEWGPNQIKFYFDGQLFLTVNESMPNRMYILLDVWFGGASGSPDGSTPTGKSNSFEIKYVRAWQRN